MSRARYAFAAHPEALADLRSVPESIRDLALLELQHLVHGNERGAALTRELAGCHKIYVDPETRWRMVVQYRDAPETSRHRREIYLLAVGERQDQAAYRTAALRLDREREASAGTAPLHGRRAQAARSRSPRGSAGPAHAGSSAPAASTATPRARRRP
ncbi:type II toxin-antitoxin system RelE/ParE family toxin [Streptomyces zaomyceticus]|uniref:type II toxin-antitoxin system RelE family toxin n=1 Tax=Streptomyces zaomyceticus TaxID=68286 RepID=UPI003253C8F8